MYRRRSALAVASALSLAAAACGERADPMLAEGASAPPAQTVVIDSVRMRLLSDPAEIAGGTLRFRVIGESQAVRPGDIVAGIQGDGFLRKVVDVQRTEDVVVLRTEAADLAEAIQNGEFHATLPVPFGMGPPARDGPLYSMIPAEIDYMAVGVSLGSHRVNFGNVTLLDTSICTSSGGAEQRCGDLKVGIASGGVSFTSWLDMDGSVSGLTLNEAHVRVDGTLGFNIETWAEVGIAARKEFEKPLLTQKHRSLALLAGVPTWVTVTTQLLARVTVDAGGAFRATSGFQSEVDVSVGAAYVRGQGMQRIATAKPRMSGNGPKLTAYPQASVTVAIEPRVTVTVNGSADSFIGLEAYGAASVRPDNAKGVAVHSLTWGLNAQAGVSFRIFRKELGELTFTLHLYDKVLASGQTQLPRIPTAIAPVSGNGQTAVTGAKLPQPLLVRVTDVAGRPVPGADVLFAVAGGGGAVSAARVTTSSTGEARVEWTLGAAVGAQAVTARLAALSSASTRFTATAVTPAPAPTVSRVSPNPVPGSASEQTLTVNGGGFVTGAKLVFRANGNRYEVTSPKVTVVNASQIQARVTLGTTAATWSVQVANPDGKASSQLSFQVTAPPATSPSISRVSPNPVPAMTGEQTLTVDGGGFAAGARLIFRVNGNRYEVSGSRVTVVSASRIQARVTLGMTAARWSVQVVNANGRDSNQLSFQVTAPPVPYPAIRNVSPDPFRAVNSEQTLTINGNGFVSGAELIFRVNGNTYRVRSSNVTVNGPTQIRARVNLGSTRARWTVEVVNPGGKASGQYAFQVG